MDLNELRSLLTALMFAVFIGIVLWAWSGRREADFDVAARLPFDDERTEGGRR
ncbi:MAG: cbb3-type cytochrome c oxidase subunit 3 [Burkholderiales bacterium]|nr:cbb3-type cytochrome c oxidase subunit 3 [Burkholderiales bacterium]